MIFFYRHIFETSSSTKFHKKKIRTVGAELFHADKRRDGWTDMMKLIVSFFPQILRTILKMVLV